MNIEYIKAQKQQLDNLARLLGVPTTDEMLGEKTVVEMTDEEYKDYFGAYDKFVEMEENKVKDEI